MVPLASRTVHPVASATSSRLAPSRPTTAFTTLFGTSSPSGGASARSSVSSGASITSDSASDEPAGANLGIGAAAAAAAALAAGPTAGRGASTISRIRGGESERRLSRPNSSRPGAESYDVDSR